MKPSKGAESGEMLDSILATYPAKYSNELRELLDVVVSFKPLAEEIVPPPMTARRVSAKQDFLALAREMREEEVAQISGSNSAARLNTGSLDNQGVSNSDLGTSTSINPNSSSSGVSIIRPTKPNTAPQESWLQRLGAAFDSIFHVPAQRLAPIAALLLIGIMSLASFYTVAWSVPGDLAYPFKEWARQVEVDLASPEDLPEVVAAQK